MVPGTRRYPGRILFLFLRAGGRFGFQIQYGHLDVAGDGIARTSMDFPLVEEPGEDQNGPGPAEHPLPDGHRLFDLYRSRIIGQ